MLDNQTLHQLLEMEVESFEGDPSLIDISSLIAPAKEFSDLVRRVLQVWCAVHLDDLTMGQDLLADCNNAIDVTDVMMQQGGAPYLYWMEHEGHGVGTWDSNEWESLFKSEDTEPLSHYVLKYTKPAYQILKEAMTDAAVATINNVKKLLDKSGACKDARIWANNYTSIEAMWNECPRGDWLLWLADAIDIDGRLIITRAAVMCSNLLSKSVPTDDELVRNLFQAAITYCDSEGTYLDQLDLKEERNKLLKIAYEENNDYSDAVESLLDATRMDAYTYEAAAIYKDHDYYPIEGAAEVVRQYITAEMITKASFIYLAQ